MRKPFNAIPMPVFCFFSAIFTLGAPISSSFSDELCYSVLEKALKADVMPEDIPQIIDLDTEILERCHKRDELMAQLIEKQKEIMAEVDDVSITTTSADTQSIGTFFSGENNNQIDLLSADDNKVSSSHVHGQSSPLYVVYPLGTSQNLKAVITDNNQTWTISVGSKLPGGVTVQSISPHKVIVQDKNGKRELGWKSPVLEEETPTPSNIEALLNGSLN